MLEKLERLRNLGNKPTVHTAPGQSPSRSKRTFAGQTINEIKDGGVRSGPTLVNTRMSSKTQESLNAALSSNKQTYKTSVPFNNRKEEMFAVYSDGEYEIAASMVSSQVNAMRDKAPPDLMLMLMDCYRALGNQDKFEKVAFKYSEIHGRSAPAYSQSIDDGANNQKTLLLFFTEKLDNKTIERLKDIALNPTQYSSMRLNFVKFEVAEYKSEDFALIKNSIQNARKSHQNDLEAIVMGDDNLFTQVKEKAPDNEEAALLCLEVAQWLGDETIYDEWFMYIVEKFDIVSSDFDKTFPSKKQNENVAEEDMIDFSVIDDNNVEAFLEKQNNENKTLNFMGVIRLTFSAATYIWSQFPEKDVTFTNATVMINGILGMAKHHDVQIIDMDI